MGAAAPAAAAAACFALPAAYPFERMGVLDAETRRLWPPLSVPSFMSAALAPAGSANSIQQFEPLMRTPTTSPSLLKNAARSSSVTL